MELTLDWQELVRFEGLNVKDYIAVGMKNKNPEQIEKALYQVLLEPKDYLNRLIDKTLSGGERKRIELAAVLAMKPKLAILDEPAYYEYNEVHFHGEDGGIEVVPRARVNVGKNSHFATNFSLLKGRVGVFDLDYEVRIQ